MPTITDLPRQRRRLSFFIERDGARGGPFAAVLDADQILDGDGGRRGRLTLRTGLIRDPFLRAWVLRDAPGGDVLELAAVDDDGELVARWILSEVRLLEIADRRRRAEDDPSFDYILLQALATPDDRY